MKILAFDTSTKAMSVALVEEEMLIAEKTINIKRDHSVGLMPAIEALLDDVHCQPSELDRIVVAKGPGSYTGIRIAVTVAKTLAWTLNCELVGISSLEALAAASVYPPNTLVVPLFDARRRNVYAGLYRQEVAGKLTAVMPDSHRSIEELLADLTSLDEPIRFVGEDVPVFWEAIQAALGERAQFDERHRQVVSAYYLARLGAEHPAEEVPLFVPEYLKLAEAEENWLQDHGDMRDDQYVKKIKHLD